MSNSPSATPILDLVKPLPKPYDERVRARFAAPLLLAVACAAVTQNYSLLAILVGAILVSFLASFVHELGHLCVGWCVGYRFDGVTIGPLVIKRLRTGLSCRLRPRLSGGYTYMTPKRVFHIRRSATMLTLGGPLASLFLGLTAIVASEVVRAYSDSESALLTFAGFFGVYSVFVGILSCVPYRVGHFANDAMLIRTFRRPGVDARALIAAHALGALKNINPDGVYWNTRWVQLASKLRFKTPYHASWYAYWAAVDPASAGPLLEACLANSGWVEREHPTHLIAEAAKFCARDKSDCPKAQKWFARLGDINRLDPLSQARLQAALFSAKGDVHAAVVELDRGLALICQSPPSVARRDAEVAWKAWKVQIEARAAAGPAAAHQVAELAAV